MERTIVRRTVIFVVLIVIIVILFSELSDSPQPKMRDKLILISSQLSGSLLARNEGQANLNDQFQLSSGSSKPEMREGDEGRQQTSKRRQTFLSKYHIDHFHYHFHDIHAILTNICFRYMSRLRTRVDSVGDSGIEMSPRESTY